MRRTKSGNTSLRQLAREFGVSASCLSQVRCGKRPASAKLQGAIDSYRRGVKQNARRAKHSRGQNGKISRSVVLGEVLELAFHYTSLGHDPSCHQCAFNNHGIHNQLAVCRDSSCCCGRRGLVLCRQVCRVCTKSLEETDPTVFIGSTSNHGTTPSTPPSCWITSACPRM